MRLGKTNLKVSRVGMGGIPITRPPEEEAIKVVRRALDLGVTFIDTARGYGVSESRIGKGIADRREEVILATKGGYRDKELTLNQIDESLQNLSTDYIDLWQFHGVSSFEWLDRILSPGGGMEGAKKALEEGKIRHIGISSHSLETALKAVESGYFETIQFPFNYANNEAADKLIPLAKDHDVGFISMKPFGGGLLNDANLSIKYLLQYDNVLPDPGIEKISEIEEIVVIVNGSWELTSDELTRMDEIRSELGTKFCRRCGYCMPCDQGVFIPGLMNLKLLEGLWSREWYLNWDYVKFCVESSQKCIECGECEEKCPYNLPIREMIKENVAFYQQLATKH